MAKKALIHILIVAGQLHYSKLIQKTCRTSFKAPVMINSLRPEKNALPAQAASAIM